MLCTNCSKLSILHTKKNCVRCQGEVLINISVLCEACSLNEKICSACLKKVANGQVPIRRKCNCGRK